MDVLSCLKSFVFLVRYKNFSTVGSLLHISTSKISKQMAWLERNYGHKLFIRSTRQIILSDFGKILYPKAIKLLEEADQLKYLPTSEKPTTTLQLYISATPIVPYLTNLNLKFLKQNPQLILKTIVGADILSGGEERTNLTISFSNSKQPHLYTGKLFAIQRSVFAAPEYIKKHEKIKKIEDLLEHNCMINTLYNLQDRWIFGNEVLQVSGNFHSNNAAVLKQAAVSGLGLIWAPRFTVQEEIKEGSLVPVLEREVSPYFTIYYAYSRFVDSIDTVRELLKFYEENLTKDYS